MSLDCETGVASAMKETEERTSLVSSEGDEFVFGRRSGRLTFLRDRSISEESKDAMTGSRGRTDTLRPSRMRRKRANSEPTNFQQNWTSSSGHTKDTPETQKLPPPSSLGRIRSAPLPFVSNRFDVDVERMVSSLIAPILPPEVEKGNVEYKVQLLNVTPERFRHLVTQMQWRLTEGYNEAIYQIGVEDGGHPIGLLKSEMEESLGTLKRMASSLNATTNVLHMYQGHKSPDHVVAEVLIRQLSATDVLLELRVAVIGGVASGKSTLVGVLTSGMLDNGSGGARMNVLRHQHELESGGRTSSISHSILGFDSNGDVINYSRVSHKANREIVRESSKLLTFMDLAGHERFLKTTAFGLTGSAPDYALLVVAADVGVGRMTKEHLGIALALKLPIVVVVTKIDKVPAASVKKICKLLTRIFQSSGSGRAAVVIDSVEDVMRAVKTQKKFGTSTIPIFPVSNVTGKRLDLLRRCLNLLPVRHDYEHLKRSPAEFRVFDSFTVENIGTVVAGTVLSGVIKTGDRLLLGPDGMTGSFGLVQVKSVHTKRLPVPKASAGQSATLAISLVGSDDTLVSSKDKDYMDDDSDDDDVAPPISRERPLSRHLLRKGVVLVHPTLRPVAAREIEVDLLLLFHPSGISSCHHQVFVHAQTVCQQVQIVSMSVPRMRTGHRARVRLRFLFHAEYLHVGSTVFVRDGRGKGVGTILALHAERRVDDDEGTLLPPPKLLRTGSSNNERTRLRRQRRHKLRVDQSHERDALEASSYDRETVDGQSRMELSPSPTREAR